MRRPVQLLIIDPQNDFCDLPASYCATDPLTGALQVPALPVPGAHDDMCRLARFIDAAGARLGGITVTLDSHHRLDIAHTTFWQTGDGGSVAPFTAITAEQVQRGEYRPRDAAALPRCLAYLGELEARGRYTLVAWPVHCEIGSWGHGVHPEVRAACNRWAESQLRHVGFVAKGLNPWTEHYSAIEAEVPDHADADTQVNAGLIARLATADPLFIAGEAGSHCVRATTEHLVDHLPAGDLSRLVLLADGMSPVHGYAAEQQAFVDAMVARGLQRSTTIDALERLPA